MKTHIGCGSVYLEGWFNVDVKGPHTYLAEERPDLVERWITTEDRYYARHEDKTQDRLRDGPLEQEYVCDYYGDLEHFPGSYGQTSEILARHTFEHLSIREARRALDAMEGVLAPNGILRLDVPDHNETCRLMRETGDAFYERHLLGPRRNEYGYHMMSYTRERLRTLVEDHGFIFEGEEENIHFYPAFCLRFVKPGPRLPVDYAKPPYDIDPNWRVGEIGPGAYPLYRADLFIDHDSDRLDPLAEMGKNVLRADIMSGLNEIPDKHFDYLWCSHVMEHVPSPERAAATISRIAKRGTIVMPSVMKEAIGGFEERDHRWLIIPNPQTNGVPIFVRQNAEYIEKIRDVDFQKIQCRMIRTGPNKHDEARYLRRWWYKTEPDLDIVVHWENEFKVQVIG
jgi:predicted SAM-dependent methyltransferase